MGVRIPFSHRFPMVGRRLFLAVSNVLISPTTEIPPAPTESEIAVMLLHVRSIYNSIGLAIVLIESRDSSVVIKALRNWITICTTCETYLLQREQIMQYTCG